MNPVFVVAAATARQRMRAPATIIAAVVLFLLALTRGTAQGGTDIFSGLSGLWFQLITLLLGAGLISEEVESGHAQLVLLRPLTRAQWVSGRFAGAAAVLCCAGTIAWVLAFVMAAVRGEPLHLMVRMAVLPLALVHALAWLAAFAIVGAVTPAWSNAAIVVAVYAAWKAARYLLPLALPHRPELATALQAMDPYFGPQDSLPLAAQLETGERLIVTPALWNLFGMAAAWWGSVELFKRRELARRRA